MRAARSTGMWGEELARCVTGAGSGGFAARRALQGIKKETRGGRSSRSRTPVRLGRRPVRFMNHHRDSLTSLFLSCPFPAGSGERGSARRLAQGRSAPKWWQRPGCPLHAQESACAEDDGKKTVRQTRKKGGTWGGKGGVGRFSGSGSGTRIKAPPTCSLDEVSLSSQSVSLRDKDQRDSPLFCLVQQHRFQTRPARSRGSSGLWRRTDLCLRLYTSRTHSISEERWVMKWKCEKQA